MTFKEIFENKSAWFLRTENYDELDIELVENSKDEIKELAVEALKRINGQWIDEEDDIIYQKMFWDSFEYLQNGEPFKGHIGAQFLRNNMELLQ